MGNISNISNKQDSVNPTIESSEVNKEKEILLGLANLVSETGKENSNSVSKNKSKKGNETLSAIHDKETNCNLNANQEAEEENAEDSSSPVEKVSMISSEKSMITSDEKTGELKSVAKKGAKSVRFVTEEEEMEKEEEEEEENDDSSESMLGNIKWLIGVAVFVQGIISCGNKLGLGTSLIIYHALMALFLVFNFYATYGIVQFKEKIPNIIEFAVNAALLTVIPSEVKYTAEVSPEFMYAAIGEFYLCVYYTYYLGKGIHQLCTHDFSKPVATGIDSQTNEEHQFHLSLNAAIIINLYVGIRTFGYGFFATKFYYMCNCNISMFSDLFL